VSPLYANVAIGISAASRPIAAIVDVRHDSRSGSTKSAISTTTSVPTSTRLGASACQSKCGVAIVAAAASI